MNLFELSVKIKAEDEASGTISKIASGLGKGLATAAKIGTAAVGAAATGIAFLTKQAVSNYAEYEQLIGGAELMFGEAFESVKKYSQDAYKTVQMSQNEYLQQVNGFATGLKTALGGNEQVAADLAHKIIQAEADVVAATGNSQEAVQNAFNGIMKSNFSMLDNLQIGITPTKEGFQEVIDKVNAWNKANGNATKYQMGNLADMQTALVDYIDMVGMSGYAQREASETITGSLASMNAAWNNLITGFADDSADFEGLIGNLVDSVVGYTDESGNKVNGVLDNLLPAVEKSVGGIAKLIAGAAPKIVEILPGLVESLVPTLISAATGLVNSVIKVLPNLLEMVAFALLKNAPVLMSSAIELIDVLTGSVLSMLPEIVRLGLDLIVSLANGIADSIPELAPTIIDVILQIVDTLTSQEQLANILNAALMIIEKLAYGLMDAIPQLVDVCFTIIENIIDFLIDPANLGMILKAAFDIIIALGTGIVSSIPRLLEYWVKVPASIIENFKNTDWGKLGTDLVDGFKNGISRAWTNLKSWFKNLFGDLIGIAKKILGIASPSKVFKKLGSFTADGFGIGFDEEFAKVKGDMEGALTFDDPSIGIHSSVRTIGAKAAEFGYGGTSIGNVNITVNGANYADEQSLAVAIAETIQNMTDRRIAVYA